MADKERIQLNLRLDGRRELLDAVKAAAEANDISINEFVIRSLRAVTKRPELIHLQPEPIAVPLDATLEEKLPLMLDKLLGERLASIKEELRAELGELAA